MRHYVEFNFASIKRVWMKQTKIEQLKLTHTLNLVLIQIKSSGTDILGTFYAVSSFDMRLASIEILWQIFPSI